LPAMLLKLFLLVALSAFVFTADFQCGRIYDGNTKGVDSDYQSFNTSIGANWEGFGDLKNKAIHYEWSVISESQASQIRDGNCRTQSGFRGTPDTLGWRSVGRSESGESFANLKTGNKYYVVLRITTITGTHYYANSNGITIVESKSSSSLKRTKFTRTTATYSGEPVFFPNGAVFVGWDNPIDQANRENAAKVSVAEKLNKIYGLPQYAQDELANVIFTTVPTSTAGRGYGVNFNPFPTPFPKRLIMDDDDDGSHLNDGAIIGIAIGVTAFFCIMVMCVIVIAFIVTGLRKNSDDDGVSRGRKGGDEF